MIPEDSRFEAEPEALVEPSPLPEGWSVRRPDPDVDVEELTALLRRHEAHGRGWAGAGEDDVLVEVSEHGLRMRENLVVEDSEGAIRAWGSVHDRAGGRMMFIHVVDRSLEGALADTCARLVFAWADGQAEAVGAARGLESQQIDTGAFRDDERQTAWLAQAGYEHVRTWWQMSRPTEAGDAERVSDPAAWESDGVRVRRVRRAGDGMPEEQDLREVHEVLEEAFLDHFNSHEETFAEFVHRLREDPGHRWDHWWLAELVESSDAPGERAGEALGCLVGTVSESSAGPDGSYVSYLGVRDAARGRGVGTKLLDTIVADAAVRGRDRVGLEVDADSPTRAGDLYEHLGWRTKYVTQSWHRYVPVGGAARA